MRRNNGLDFLKFICAFLVVCIHTSFPGEFGKIVTPLTRIAVPIFFMITGYYYTFISEKNQQKKQLKKMVVILCGANILYCMIEVLSRIDSLEQLLEYVRTIFSKKTLFEFVLFNESPFSGHLWYMGAIVYVLLIVFILEKVRVTRTKIYWTVPVLLLIDLLFGKYSLVVFRRTFPYIWVRNFMFVGLPYFLIGDMVFRYKRAFKKQVLSLVTMFFIFTTLLERLLLGMAELNAPRDHYLSTTLLAVSVFLLALQCENKNDNVWFKYICYIGARLTLWIYVLHPIVIMVLNKVINFVGNKKISTLYQYVASVCVYVISIAVSYGINLISKSVKNNVNRDKQSNGTV